MRIGSGARQIGRLAAAVTLSGGLLLVTPGTAFASVPIVFSLTGTFTEGVMVSYMGANDEPEIPTVGLPWSVAYDYNGNAQSLTFSGMHTGPEPGSVTCQISVNGRQIESHTNNGPKHVGNGAYCNILNMGSGYRGH